MEYQEIEGKLYRECAVVLYDSFSLGFIKKNKIDGSLSISPEWEGKHAIALISLEQLDREDDMIRKGAFFISDDGSYSDLTFDMMKTGGKYYEVIAAADRSFLGRWFFRDDYKYLTSKDGFKINEYKFLCGSILQDIITHGLSKHILLEYHPCNESFLKYQRDKVTYIDNLPYKFNLENYKIIDKTHEI